MSDSSRTGYGNTDAAALGAATLAVAFPMFGDPGPFTPISTVLSLTLVFLVLGYVWGHQRNTMQILAVAASLALMITPIFGFVLELIYADNRAALIQCGHTKACSGAADLGVTSNVSPVVNLICWLIIFVGAWVGNKKAI